MARVKIGDIIEIKTKTGLFYAQYTHRDPEYVELIQVAKVRFDKRPDSLEDIVNAETGIITFFPVNIAVHRKIFPVIGNIPVPKKRQQFPLFRVAGFPDKKGKVKQWWFWNGDEAWPEVPVKKLTDEQKRLPIEGIWNDTLLIERLESDWAPEYDVSTV